MAVPLAAMELPPGKHARISMIAHKRLWFCAMAGP